jgi:hypothetical protein
LLARLEIDWDALPKLSAEDLKDLGGVQIRRLNSARLRYASILCRVAPFIIAAPFSAIMIVGAFVLVEGSYCIVEGLAVCEWPRRSFEPFDGLQSATMRSSHIALE